MSNNNKDNTNNSPLTQREFDRFLVDHRLDIKELKDSISAVDKKLDQIATKTIPALQVTDAKLSTKTKLMWTLFVGGLSTLVTIAVTLLKASVGL